MTAMVLGWDPQRGPRWVPSFEHALAQFARTGGAQAPWLVCEEPVPAPGTVVHLMLQGPTRGLVGRGVVLSRPYLAGRADQPGAPAQHVLVDWDHLLPIDERIRPEELHTRVPGVAWGELYAPAVVLPFRAAHELERVWAAPHPSAGPSRRRLQAARTAAERAASGVAHEVAHDAGAVLAAVHHLVDRAGRRGA
ncbi:MAG TPA: hypothetical protein VF143_11740 [Candidatus Nanopelagicales bacterium]